MAFDCVYPGIGIADAPSLTRDAIDAAARERGLASVYVVESVVVVPRRWRRRTVDVIVRMADGDDVLGMQFPDEARAAVTAAVDTLRRARPTARSVAGEGSATDRSGLGASGAAHRAR